MAVDTPATIAILGAGPIGLEAALYARYLGYDVIIFEKGNEVADHVRQWGHVVAGKFGELHSPLGLAAVRMHHENYVPPTDGVELAGREWREKYLIPLAETDLIADNLRLGRKVIGVCKTEILRSTGTEFGPREDWMFRILSESADGTEYNDEAEIVIDATGVQSNPNWAGEGGLPAMGERAARAAGKIEYGLPEVLGKDRERFAAKHTLVFGSNREAMLNAELLTKLGAEAPGTKVTCVAQQVNDTASEVAFNWLQQIADKDGRVEVTFGGALSHSDSFDVVIANVGFHADNQLSDHLLPSEPNFWVIGQKHSARTSREFTFLEGLRHVRETFAIIGDRPTLDLYANAPPSEP